MTKETCKSFTEGSFAVSKERTAYYKSLLITTRSRVLLEKLILPQLEFSETYGNTGLTGVFARVTYALFIFIFPFYAVSY
jgi:hypothetical protein